MWEIPTDADKRADRLVFCPQRISKPAQKTTRPTHPGIWDYEGPHQDRDRIDTTVTVKRDANGLLFCDYLGMADEGVPGFKPWGGKWGE